MQPPDVNEEFARALGAQEGTITFLRSSQNIVYEFIDQAGRARILRLTPHSHRSRAEIQDELEWLCSLHQDGLPVCPPVPRADGSLIFSTPGTAEDFHSVVFERALGTALTKDDLSTELYYLHGKSLGALHSHAAKAPCEFLEQRRSWDEERYFTTDPETYIPAEVRDAVRETWQHLRSELRALPVDPATQGPVHLDLGYSNFFLNGDHLQIFDFDNCCRGFHACDIAVALYGSLFNLLRCEFPGDRSAFAHPKTSFNLEKVFAPFRAGYESKAAWQEDWNGQLSLWLEFAYFRSVIHAFRMQHPVTNPRSKALLDIDIENLLTRQPPVRFDFQAGKALP